MFFIDRPAPGIDFPDTSQTIGGWISSNSKIAKIEICAGQQSDKHVKHHRRKDVEKANRGKFKYHTGFESSLTLDDFRRQPDKPILRVTLEDNTSNEAPLNLPDMQSAKLEKLKRIITVIECPECRSALTPEWTETATSNHSTLKGVKCDKCGAFYGYNGNSLDFLTETFKTMFSITPTGNVSQWGYDSNILELITAKPEGLFLDCGAGWRAVNYNNVINYEIQDYPSTDILGVGEKLPFADNSFDGIFSVAVLEHVADPVLCAREITRVLKPGGTLFCAAAFLSPVHAYPNHYYNMTSQGLQTLFKDLEITRKFVPLALHPMKTVGWILRSYAAGLPEHLRKKFINMRVGELAGMDDFENMENNPLVKALPEEKQFELANGTAIIAKKKS